MSSLARQKSNTAYYFRNRKSINKNQRERRKENREHINERGRARKKKIRERVRDFIPLIPLSKPVMKAYIQNGVLLDTELKKRGI